MKKKLYKNQIKKLSKGTLKFFYINGETKEIILRNKKN